MNRLVSMVALGASAALLFALPALAEDQPAAASAVKVAASAAAAPADPAADDAAAIIEAAKPKPRKQTCTRLGSSVNDYGKAGPAADAKKLLDVHAAKWAAEHGVKHYTLGKKTVKCELFLDFGLFDEYTCDAQANLCY